MTTVFCCGVVRQQTQMHPPPQCMRKLWFPPKIQGDVVSPWNFDLLQNGCPSMVGEGSNNISHVAHKTHVNLVHVHNIELSILVFTTCIGRTFSPFVRYGLPNGSNKLVTYVALFWTIPTPHTNQAFGSAWGLSHLESFIQIMKNPVCSFRNKLEFQKIYESKVGFPFSNLIMQALIS